MDFAAKHEIDRFDKQQIPWRRMFTAYGTAENDCEYLSVLEQTLDVQEWKKTFRKLSDFEHQSTFFPPAPFALVFLVHVTATRVDDRRRHTPLAVGIVGERIVDGEELLAVLLA